MLAPTPKERKLLIAAKQDAPRVSIRGTVRLPDGSPVSDGGVSFSATFFVLSENGESCGRGLYSGGQRVQEDGTFQLDKVPPEASMIISAGASGDKHRKLVAKPVVLSAIDGLKPLEIKLVEGIPVRGKIKYENGFPAAHRSLGFNQQAEPIFESELPGEWGELRTFRWGTADADGEYEIFLLPGEYTVYDKGNRKGQNKPLSIAATDKEKRLDDWIMPTPIFVKVVQDDGTYAGIVHYHVLNEFGSVAFGSGVSSEKRSVPIEPITCDTTIYLTDMWRNEQGTIETLTPAMVGKTVQFKLKPMGNVAITLVDAEGKPVVDKQISWTGVGVMAAARQTEPIGFAITNTEGKAVFRVAPGKMPMMIHLPGSVEEPLPEGGTETKRNIERNLDLAPGATVDFGVVTLTKVR